MREEEIKETDLWQLYQKGVTHLRFRNAYTKTDDNFRMYNGDPWYGLQHGDMEPVALNIIKPIVKYKVNTLTANLWAINYSAENYDNPEFQKTAEKVCKNLNKHAARVWEKDFMDEKIKLVAKKSGINSESYIYVNYDTTTGEPTNEILSKVDVYLGDENSMDIQSQPYIVIKTRKPLNEVIEIAKKNGLSAEKIKSITSDTDTLEQAGEYAKYEINDMCILLTKLYKKNGKVYFSKSTKTVDIIENKNSGLTLYPLDHFVWEEEEGSARGVGEVEGLIPNQREINKTLMRRALAVRMGAYPKPVYDEDKISNPQDVTTIGTAIKVKGQGVDDINKVFGFTRPAQMSSDAKELQDVLVTVTRELAGAGDMALGTVDPEKASGRAILAVQEASKQPLTEQLTGLKSFIERIARIWLDIWRAYSKDGKTVFEEVEAIDPTTGVSTKTLQPFKIEKTMLDTLRANTKVDITPKGAFDKYAVELSVENLASSANFMNNQWLEDYSSLLDDDSKMPKMKIDGLIEKRKKAQQEIASAKMQADRMKSQFDQVANVADEITNAQESQTMTPQMA